MNKKGITLISLIITIIILLILTGISIGAINYARVKDSAKKVTNRTEKQIEEHEQTVNEVNIKLKYVKFMTFYKINTFLLHF